LVIEEEAMAESDSFWGAEEHASADAAGAAVPEPEPERPDTVAPAWDGDTLRWRCVVPVLSDRFAWTEMARQLPIVLVIPTLIFGVIGLAARIDARLFALVLLLIYGISAGSLALFQLGRALAFGNRHGADYWVGPEDVGWRGGPAERAKMRTLARFMFALVLLLGRGPGSILDTKYEERRTKWARDSKVTYRPDLGVVLVGRGIWPPVALHCPGDMYGPVAAAVRKYAAGFEDVAVTEAAEAAARKQAPPPAWEAFDDEDGGAGKAPADTR
jgi:hypothetical protein